MRGRSVERSAVPRRLDRVDPWQRHGGAELLQVMLRDRIVFRPITGEDGAAMYELTIPIAFDRLFVKSCLHCRG